MALHRRVLIHVDTTDKTDDEVAAEVAEQLKQGGLASPSVRFDRMGDRVRVRFTAIDHDGGGYHIEVRQSGPMFHLNLVDDAREPGMTDAEFRAKIERQLRDDGVDLQKVTISIAGDQVHVLIDPPKPEEDDWPR